MPNALIVLAVILSQLAWRLGLKVRVARRQSRGAIYQPAIFSMMLAGYLLSVGLAFSESRLGLWTPRAAVPASGLFLYLAALLLQWRAFRDLGSAYSPDIEVRAGQPLVQHGLYRHIRHPLLLALLLELVGIALAFQAYVTLGFIAAAVFPLLEKRRREEEKILYRHFNGRYETYARHVGALFPKLGGSSHAGNA